MLRKIYFNMLEKKKYQTRTLFLSRLILVLLILLFYKLYWNYFINYSYTGGNEKGVPDLYSE